MIGFRKERKMREENRSFENKLKETISKSQKKTETYDHKYTAPYLVFLRYPSFASERREKKQRKSFLTDFVTTTFPTQKYTQKNLPGWEINSAPFSIKGVINYDQEA